MKLKKITKFEGEVIYKILESDAEGKGVIDASEIPENRKLVFFDDGTAQCVPCEEFTMLMKDGDISDDDKEADKLENKNAELEDSCEICGHIPKVKEIKLRSCGHSFHRDCNNRWKGCPHCNFESFVKRFPKTGNCPNRFCSTNLSDLRGHIRDAHAPEKCGLCKRNYLKHARIVHDRLNCGTHFTKCPAENCKESITYAYRHLGKLNPKILIEDHECASVVSCLNCGELFVNEKRLLNHSIKKECAATITRPLKKRRQSYKVMEQFEALKRENLF